MWHNCEAVNDKRLYPFCELNRPCKTTTIIVPNLMSISSLSSDSRTVLDGDVLDMSTNTFVPHSLCEGSPAKRSLKEVEEEGKGKGKGKGKKADSHDKSSQMLALIGCFWTIYTTADLDQKPIPSPLFHDGVRELIVVLVGRNRYSFYREILFSRYRKQL